MTLPPRVLEPRLRPRIVYLVLSLLLLALSLTAVILGGWAAIAGVLLFGAATVNGVMRMFGRRSYATELDATGFKVYDSFGKLVHDVLWEEVEELVPFRGNSLAGPGTQLHVAWRCNPRRPGKGRQPWARGGDGFDGALPDAYLGFEETLALMLRYANAEAPGAPPARPAADLQSF
jgi:uncharacterized protein (DUF58 family)